MAEKLLAPGMTKLGSMKVSIQNGPQQDVDIYYGNIFWDKNDKAHKLPDKNYREKLDKYLKEHPDYKRPTDVELVEDFKRARTPGSPGTIPPSQRQKQANVSSVDRSQYHDERSNRVEQNGNNANMSNDMRRDNYDRNSSRQNYEDYDDYDDDYDYDNHSKHKANRTVKKNKRRTKNERFNNDYDDYDYDEDDEQEEDYGNTEHSKAIVMAAIAGISIAINVFLYCCLQGVLPFFNNNNNSSNKSKSAPTYEVAQVSKDLAQGDVITKSDLKKVTITQKQYSEKSNGKYVKADGTVDNNTIILWDNRNDAVGKYVTDSMKEGEYLTTSDVSELKDGETTISLDLNGQKVTVPVNVTTAGSSEIHLYAICTTTNEDKSKKTAAVDLGEFKLEGRTISDILNSEGQSKLSEYLSDAEKNSN